MKIVDDAKTRVRECTVDDVRRSRAAGEKFLLVDVREDSEWTAAHAAGAIHLGRGIIERDIVATAPDKGSKLVLYCGGGYRSALAADNLQKMGYTSVVSMDGGWRGWNEAGYDVEGA